MTEKDIKFLSTYYKKLYASLTSKNTKHFKGNSNDINNAIRGLVAKGIFNPQTSYMSDYSHREIASVSKLINKAGKQKDKDNLALRLHQLAICDCKIFDKKYPTFRLTVKDIINAVDDAELKLAQRSFTSFYEEEYLKTVIGGDIAKLIPSIPEEQYPEARNIKRKFILHIGPTNSGKTYESIERLKTAKNGIYLGPLRLLALEIFDKLNDANVPCTMKTGEEIIDVPYSRVQSSTIEMMNTHDAYDIAVVDECQMLSDPLRGHNWTKAILGLCANEIHLCMAPGAENIVISMIERCHDELEIIRHERNTKLTFVNTPFRLKDVQQGDALIVFSKRAVLSLSAELESRGIKTSVIYGNLPPTSRKEQVRRFVNGETSVVVSTDAIGQGLNLPIKRIIFTEIEKFDGKERRLLLPEEIKQIAGRAGRYKMYDEGFVLSKENCKYVSECLVNESEQIKKAHLGFPDVLLDVPAGLKDTIVVWSKMKTPDLYDRMQIDLMLELYERIDSFPTILKERYSKTDVYKMITCPVDTKNESNMELWEEYCRTFLDRDTLLFPKISSISNLDLLETHYRNLDLYFQFSNKVGKRVEEDRLEIEKSETAKAINKILIGKKKNLGNKCKVCGKSMPYNSRYRICESCYSGRYW